MQAFITAAGDSEPSQKRNVLLRSLRIANQQLRYNYVSFTPLKLYYL